MNGSQYERKLCRILDEQGWHVMRAPSSGSATKRDLPDILFSKVNEPIVGVEMKATSDNIAYFTEDEAYKLEQFTNAFGGNPRLCTRFKGDTSFYLHRIGAVRLTDGNRYAVDKSMNADMVIEP